MPARGSWRNEMWRQPVSGCVLLAVLLAGCTLPSREALLVLEDLAAGDAPSRLKKQTAPPARKTLAFHIENREYVADLYTPTDAEPAIALLLVPGVAEAGKDDPRLVAFAETFARVRFRVLVPDLPSLRTLQVSPANIGEIADAFLFLVSGRAFPAPATAGIGAFSYAVGPAILAADRPELRNAVDFVLGVGGYHDLKHVITFFTTGYFRVNDRWRYREPNRYGKWLFVLSNAGRLPHPNDRRLLRRMAERRIADPHAPIADLAASLHPEGRSVYELLINEDPKRAPQLIARLPSPLRAVVNELDLANKDLGRIRARLILVHGSGDDIIPYTESMALAAAFPPDQVDLYVVGGLGHVDLEPPGLYDLWRLWQAADAVLAIRDQTAGAERLPP